MFSQFSRGVHHGKRPELGPSSTYTFSPTTITASDHYLRVVTLADRVTIHTRFPTAMALSILYE